MFALSLLAAGALALQTSAFLVPLEVSRGAGIAQMGEEMKHQVVELDCPQCPFAGADGDGSVWSQGDDSVKIRLDLDITDDDQFLQINGQPVYPPPRTLIPVALKAPEIQTSDQSQSQPLRLGYALEVLPAMTEVSDVTLTPIELTVLDLEGVSVNVDTVKIDLIQSWGHMHIARVTRLPYAESPGANVCTTSICRLRAIIANRLRKMVQSAKAHAGKAKTWIKNTCSGWKHPKADAEHKDHINAEPKDCMKPHRHLHHGLHRHGRFRHFVEQTVHFFVLPAIFGVMGGLLACALGMLVGQALAYLLNRRSRRDLGSQIIETVVEADEKDALMESGEMPPQYADVDIVVVEQK
ncbi:hypothetical protein GJ744_008826 [Endocarpon pusillum]|uniref:DUF7728 domain-containing protein n=1 Tax=Endocarpon pusillum TaxID=364733 RepID=A0A8H7AV65_9EURO|nr:hypothetical protein GJ744_008826 [Endocarpon pusillum]